MEATNTFTGSIFRVYLIGMMGAGKSVTGRILSRALNYSFVDTDELIEANGVSIVEIFKQKGEGVFRQMERDTLISISQMQYAVISTGGGFPCHDNKMDDMLTNGVVIYLQASVKTLVERLDDDSANRPLLSGNPVSRAHEIDDLLRERQLYYERAHHIVNVDGDDCETIVDRIMNLLTS